MKRLVKPLLATLLALCLSCCFIPSVLAALPPSGGTIYQGIDVSEWQGAIDYQKVKEAGIQVAYIRSSLGSSYIDPYFKRNYEGFKAQGVKVGFYHYVTARTVAQAEQEARFFVSVVGDTVPDCRLAMDFESFGSLSVGQINQIAKAFVETVASESGKEVVIYSNTNDARNVFDQSLTVYPLWVAHWGVSQPGDNGKWKNWVGFQYTSSGSVNGISGRVDMDRFTDGIFLTDSQPVPKPEEQPQCCDTVTVTVKKGDTLWGLAQRYHSNVQAIAGLNHIKNPSLIYPGQVLKIPICGDPGTEPSTPSYTVYKVKKGDTLWGISRRYGTTVPAIVALNHIKNPNLIYPGDVFKIPVQSGSAGGSGQNTYVVVKGDTLWGISRRYHTTVDTLVALNNIANRNLIYPGQVIKLP